MRDKNGRFIKGHTFCGGEKGWFKKGQVTWNKGKKCPEMQGSKNSNWKGGKYKANGYIFVYIPTHPFSNKQGYIFEHRRIMEDSLKRLLVKKENVHHINKIKSDNRIENLILFSSNRCHKKYHFPKGSKFGINSHLYNHQKPIYSH